MEIRRKRWRITRSCWLLASAPCGLKAAVNFQFFRMPSGAGLWRILATKRNLCGDTPQVMTAGKDGLEMEVGGYRFSVEGTMLPRQGYLQVSVKSPPELSLRFERNGKRLGVREFTLAEKSA